MASPLDDDIFEKLKEKADSKESEKWEKRFNERLHAQFAKQEQRIADLVGNNSSISVTISEVRVLQAPRTRRAFLERICQPLLSSNRDGSYTLLEARQEIDKAAAKLNRLGIFHYPISVYLDKPDPTNVDSSPTDLNVYFHARERGAYTIKTGTETGSSEASVYGSGQLRNIFGGAESLNVHVSKGTRTRSIYSVAFDTPILSNPDFKWEISGLSSSALKPWASHEEAMKGGSTKFKWVSPAGHLHELSYSAMWRQITGLGSNASPTVRLDAGDSFKSSLTHSWINDQRDNTMLPSKGYFMKAITELAGFGPLKGDVGFGKVELESQAALPIPIPGVQGESGVSFNLGLRAGMLYPLTTGGGDIPIATRINDRFQLGGPTDVRGFKISGLGPHDGADAVGGDVYAAGGASLLFPLPRVGKDTPLRLQAFVNAGRLLALRGKPKDGAAMSSDAVSDGMKATISDLRSGLPSIAAGVGLVYAHPMARFELNFTLPMVIRRGEESRKGIQFGVGITFL